jgi:hypothetical protein
VINISQELVKIINQIQEKIDKLEIKKVFKKLERIVIKIHDILKDNIIPITFIESKPNFSITINEGNLIHIIGKYNKNIIIEYIDNKFSIIESNISIPTIGRKAEVLSYYTITQLDLSEFTLPYIDTNPNDVPIHIYPHKTERLFVLRCIPKELQQEYKKTRKKFNEAMGKYMPLRSQFNKVKDVIEMIIKPKKG